MKMLSLANRNAKEIVRDPLNLAFGLGFPIVLILLLSAIQANIPVSLFEIDNITPGISVFGLSFITLFSATLIARDRESAFLQRLYTTPMQAKDFILGYMLPLLPLSIAQGLATYLAAVFLGLPVNLNILWGILLLLPVGVFYISLGLLCGSCLNVKQVGGLCGALLTNVSAWLSGVWFDLALVGDGFQQAANLLPFTHAVQLQRAAIQGTLPENLHHLWPVLLYAAITTIGAVALFLKQMKK